MEIAERLHPEIFDKIKQDPKLYAAQLQTLQKLQRGGEQGLTVEDRARIFESQGALERAQKSGTATALANAADRGMGGSNAALMGALQSQAGGESAAAASGFQIGSEANKQSLANSANAAALASQMGNTKFGQDMEIAKAKAIIDSTNAQLSQGVQQRNIANTMASRGFNLQNEQRTNDANTALRNQLTQYNKNQIERDFNRKFDLKNAMAGAAGKYANYQSQRAGEEDARAVNMGASIGGLVEAPFNIAKGIKNF